MDIERLRRLRNLAETINEEEGILEKAFEISEYFALNDQPVLRDGVWYDYDNNPLGKEGQWVISNLTIEDGEVVFASYYLTDGRIAGTSFEDDVDGVIDLWEED